ncbi:MAG: InlB B-repeat-containing protein [Solobacterium sp.]|nr:InlB B-repeat-containing protein [Solobacterium sp.]
MKRLLSIFLAFYLAAGILPVQVNAEDTVLPEGEQSEETEPVTEAEIQEVVEAEPEEAGEEAEDPDAEVTELAEAAEEETDDPEVTAVPETGETAVPEGTVVPEMPETEAAAEEVTEAEETVPETEEEPVQDPPADATAEPVAATAEPVAEEILPETAEPVIGETVPETEEPFIEETVPETPAPVSTEPEEAEAPAEITEEITEENEPDEAPSVWTLTFDANGGLFDKYFAGTVKDMPTWSAEVKTGDPYYVRPNDYYKVNRSGYAFAGWYGNKSLEWQYELQENGYFMPSGNPEKYTVYAKWVPAYTVTFDTNGGLFADESDRCVKEVAKGEALGSCPWNDPSGFDKVFAGWTVKKNDASTKIDPMYYIPKKSLTLYALWSEEVDILYKANGGKFSSGTTEMTVAYGKDRLADLNRVSEPSKSGYAFCGWYTDPSLEEKYKVGESCLITKKLTLYAKYSKYNTVTFDGNGRSWLGYTVDGTYESGKSAVVKYVPAGAALYEVNLPFSIPDSGYSFQGWFTDKACSPEKRVNTFSFVPKTDTKLYAKWSRFYKVTFDGCGAVTESGSTAFTVKVAEDCAVRQVPGFIHASKAFAGWYTDKAYTNKVEHVYGYYPVKDTTFYAKWVTGVKVSFSANGGKFPDGTKTAVICARKGTQLRQNVRIPEREGYVFAGWYTDTSYTVKVGDPYFYEVQGAAQLYAKWVQAVKVTFDAGEGVIEVYDDAKGNYITGRYIGYYAKGSVPAEDYTYSTHNISGAAGTSAYSSLGVPYPYLPDETGKEFAGWYKEKELKNRFDPQKDRITKAITLYAKYSGKYSDSYVRITVDPNGGRLSRDTGKTYMVRKNSRFEYSLEIVVPPEGMILAGFTKVKNDPSTLLTYDFQCSDNMTVYAYYKPVCTVTLNAMSGFLTHGSYGAGYIYDVMKVYKDRIVKGETVEIFVYDYGEEYDSLATNVSGRIFKGWYSDKECTKFVTYDISRYKITKDITLYAKWGSPETPGWKKTKGQWWYRTANGDYYRDSFRRIGKAVYYFKTSGYIATGWNKIGSSWYWFADSGAMASGWKKISGKWYWFDPDGIMVTGWKKISGKWYYFAAGGAMVAGWKKISSKWYYFEGSGAMVTGWKKVSGKWYYFEGSGAMKTGWLKLSGKWYYLEGSGAMVTGTRTIGSKTYRFDSSGVCLNP